MVIIKQKLESLVYGRQENCLIVNEIMDVPKFCLNLVNFPCENGFPNKVFVAFCCVFTLPKNSVPLCGWYFGTGNAMFMKEWFSNTITDK